MDIQCVCAVTLALLRMTLSDYSMTITEIANQLCLQPGTLISIASPEPQAGGVAGLSMWQRFLNNLPAHLRALAQLHRAQAAAAAGGRGAHFWHASAVFIQRHNHYPTRPQNVPPSVPAWASYQFNGRWERVYIYDSAFPNEDPATALVSNAIAAIAAGGAAHCRIGQHRMLSVVNRLLYHAAEGLARPNNGGRCPWIRNNSTVWIGGGGNIGGVDKCQRMTAIWMMQVAQLSYAFGYAIYQFQHHPGQQTHHDFLCAEREWLAFFADYIECRP